MASVLVDHYLKFCGAHRLIGTHGSRSLNQCLLSLIVHIWIYDNLLNLRICAYTAINLAFGWERLYHTKCVFGLISFFFCKVSGWLNLWRESSNWLLNKLLLLLLLTASERILVCLAPGHDLHLVANNWLLYNQVWTLQLVLKWLNQLLLSVLLFLFRCVHLMRVLMNYGRGLNNYWVLNIRNRAVYYEVVDVIVGVDVRYMLTGQRRVMVGLILLFWRFFDINYILHLKIIILLKVFVIVSARTLIIKIDCVRLWNLSIWLQLFRLQTTLLHSLS